MDTALSSLEEAVQSTLVYASLFEYPLTLPELKRWLMRRGRGAPEGAPSLAALLQCVQEDTWCRTQVECKDGFLYLKDEKEAAGSDVTVRRERGRVSALKLRRARAAARLFAHFPFVRFIGAANKVAWGAAHQESDIDFFIVTAPGRLWSARFLVTGCAALCGWRPTPSQSADTLCLSFYVSEDALAIEALCAQKEDVHFAFWLYQVLPLYDAGGVYEALLAQNTWLGDFFAAPPKTGKIARVRFGASFAKRVFEFVLRGIVGEWVEWCVRAWQIKKLNSRMQREAPSEPQAVVFNDRVIKLHWNDRRRKYNSKFKVTLNGGVAHPVAPHPE